MIVHKSKSLNVFQCALMSIIKTKLDSHSGTRMCLLALSVKFSRRVMKSKLIVRMSESKI